MFSQSTAGRGRTRTPGPGTSKNRYSDLPKGQGFAGNFAVRSPTIRYEREATLPAGASDAASKAPMMNATVQVPIRFFIVHPPRVSSYILGRNVRNSLFRRYVGFPLAATNPPGASMPILYRRPGEAINDPKGGKIWEGLALCPKPKGLGRNAAPRFDLRAPEPRTALGINAEFW